MPDQSLDDIVYELNGGLPEELTIERGDCSFSLYSTGYVSAILFSDICLWNSDWDERETDEETGVRHYNTPDKEFLPSVTTILSQTKDPDEDNALQEHHQPHDLIVSH